MSESALLSAIPFQHHPLGSTFTGSVHSVISSLPTRDAVVGYEEKWPQVLQHVKQGYPRFLQHPLVAQVCAALERSRANAATRLFAVTSQSSAELLRAYADATASIAQHDGVFAVSIAAGGVAESRARAFLQHTGTQISSRQAEDWLIRAGTLPAATPEHLFTGDAEAHILKALAPWVGAQALLTCGGANAFYGAYVAISHIQARTGRDVWIQLGWVYVDSGLVLERFHGGATPIKLLHTDSLDALEAYLESHGARVAGIVCEAPSNPLLETCDLARVHALARKHGALVILDPTVAGIVNVDVLPYSDVLTTSLTKYAARNADVLAGLIEINNSSPHAAELAELLRARITPLYARDAARLAAQVDAIGEFVQRVNANASALAAHLQNHPRVAMVRHPMAPSCCDHFEHVQRPGGGPGALLSVSFKSALADVFDRLPVAKAASFGARFTTASPFLYLAHYELVSTAAGRRGLIELGIDPDLVRISVGIEPIDELIAMFDEVLST